MADLFDVDGTGEGSFLGVVTLELEKHVSGMEYRVREWEAYSDSVLLVPDRVCCDGWVVTVHH